MHDLRPVALAEPGKTMLGHARMADAILLEQRSVDEGALCMNVKDPGPKFLDIRDRIDELADEVAGIPFQPNVCLLGGIEETLPHRRLAKHIIIHYRQVVWALGALFEREPHAVVGGILRHWFPECHELGDEILERFVNGIATVGVDLRFNMRPRKTRHGLDSY